MNWTDRLRLRHLKLLLALEQTQSISGAAELLNTTQPGLSKWLKDLESDVGLPLFERHARGLRPTNYGRALIRHAHRLEGQLNAAREELAAMLSSGRLVIGAAGSSGRDTAPLAALKLLKRVPQASIEVVERPIEQLVPQLQSGEVDVIVGRALPWQCEGNVQSEILYTDPAQFVVRPNHPLLAEPKIGWAELMAFRWLTWRPDTPLYDLLSAALAKAGLRLPSNNVVSDSFTLAINLLSNSDLIGTASRRPALRFQQMNVLRIVPFQLPGLSAIAMYWRVDAVFRPLVATMLDCVREAAAEYEAEP